MLDLEHFETGFKKKALIETMYDQMRKQKERFISEFEFDGIESVPKDVFKAIVKEVFETAYLRGFQSGSNYNNDELQEENNVLRKRLAIRDKEFEQLKAIHEACASELYDLKFKEQPC